MTKVVWQERADHFWSLWDLMRSVDISSVIGLACSLEKLTGLVGQHKDLTITPKMKAEIEPNLADSNIKNLSKLGLAKTAGYLKELQGVLAHEDCVCSDLTHGLAQTLESLKWESEKITFLLLNSEDAYWYKTHPKEHFGKKVWQKLQPSRYDMDEAIQCFAFERYTACVSHLTRITESALRMLAENVLGAVALHNTVFTPTNWDRLSRDIRTNLNAITSFADHNERRLKDARLIALERFDIVKVTRHESHHADGVYSKKEAENYLIQLPAFLQQVIDVI